MPRILLVEDDHDIAHLERDYLELANFTVDHLTTGDAVIAQLKSAPYDLLLLDVMLPGVDGFALCQQIRKFSDVPIILVTAKNQPSDIIKGLGLGSDDYIAKPFDPAVLVARAKASIERFRRHKHLGDELVCRDLRIQPQSRRAWVAGRELKLPGKEFDLLYFLASHPGQVFSKEDLFEEVWGMESLAHESTVTVHVNRLRDKLSRDDAAFIETVWGAGYRFRG